MLFGSQGVQEWLQYKGNVSRLYVLNLNDEVQQTLLGHDSQLLTLKVLFDLLIPNYQIFFSPPPSIRKWWFMWIHLHTELLAKPLLEHANKLVVLYEESRNMDADY
jgi:hypothetical protein